MWLLQFYSSTGIKSIWNKRWNNTTHNQIQSDSMRIRLQSSISCSHHEWPYYLWSDQALGSISHPNRHGDGESVLPVDCVRSQCEGAAGGGRGRRRGISWDHGRAPTQKGHCGTDWPIQENIISCPIRSSILRTWAFHFQELTVSFLTSSGLVLNVHSNTQF